MLFEEDDFFESRDNTDKVHTGVVIVNDDPKRLGRIKVYIRGIFDTSDYEAIPWCRPLLPSTTGGSPDRMTFCVPQIGSTVEVVFRDSYYNPLYVSSRIIESQSPKTIFGEDYPNTFGKILPSGIINRGNAISKWSESFHPSGLFQRSTIRGDFSLNVPGDLIIGVDGKISISSGYWKNGGGGLGNVLNELAYAHVNGPYLQGVLDLASMLPVSLDEEGNESPILNFYDYVTSMKTLSETLIQTLQPDYSNLQSILSTVKNKYYITRSIRALNGMSGIASMVFSFFGLFGAWSSGWLNHSEELLDGTVINLNSQSEFRKTITGSYNVEGEDTRSEWEKLQDNLEDMVNGFSVLQNVAKIFVFCDEMRIVVESVGSGNPNVIFASLPESLRSFIIEALNNIVAQLIENTSVIGEENQIKFLDSFGLFKFFTSKYSNPKFIGTCLNEILSVSGLSGERIGEYGNIIGFHINKRVESAADRYDSIKETAKNLGWSNEALSKIVADAEEEFQDMTENGVNNDEEEYLLTLTPLLMKLAQNFPKSKVMPFVEDLQLDKPIAVKPKAETNYILISQSNESSELLYLDPSTVTKFMFMDLPNLKYGSYEDGSLAADVVAAGEGSMAGTGEGGIDIDLSKLYPCGSAISTFCKSVEFHSIVSDVLGSEIAERLSMFRPNEEPEEEEGENEEEEDELDDVFKSIAYLFGVNYRWFEDFPVIEGISEELNELVRFKKLNTFLVGLDPNLLVQSGVPVEEIILFMSLLIDRYQISPENIYAYGFGINQILSSGIDYKTLFEEDTAIDTIMKYIGTEKYGLDYNPDDNIEGEEPEPWLDFPNGCMYPKLYFNNLIFGCPTIVNQSDQANMVRKRRELKILSDRISRSSQQFRNANINLTK